MNEHVNFSNDEAVVHQNSELLPVFVQDPDDYASDGLYDIPTNTIYGASGHADEDEDDEVLDFDIETESD